MPHDERRITDDRLRIRRSRERRVAQPRDGDRTPCPPRVRDLHQPPRLTRRCADGGDVSAHVDERSCHPTCPQHSQRPVDPVAHPDPAEVKLRVSVREPDTIAVQLHHGRRDRGARLAQLRRRRRRGPGPVEPPGAHQRLDRHVERAARDRLEPVRERQDCAEVSVRAHDRSSRAAVQFAQVAGRVEEREPAFHPPQLRQRRRARVEPCPLGAREQHDVHHLAHRPRPALDEDVVPGAADRNTTPAPTPSPEHLQYVTSVHHGALVGSGRTVGRRSSRAPRSMPRATS